MALSEVAQGFLDLHQGDAPLLIPNPWDAGSARLLASLGFQALATTSSGFAATLGRLDGEVTRDEALAHAAALVAAVDLPVSADLEHGFADEPDAVAETVRLAAATGLAGCSIEDSTKRPDDPIYDMGVAVDRVRAAVDAAHAGSAGIVLTARAENLLHGRDLADTIARLQAFEAAGADVVFAPGLRAIDDVRAVVASVGVPVNVLAFPGGPGVAELAAAGVARISVGGTLAYTALGAVVEAARALREGGTIGDGQLADVGRRAFRAAVAE
ncbi:MAG: isocitrate lyase/phosphoenolpyruvate mutase family protein [Acidimicrobiales bacterium]